MRVQDKIIATGINFLYMCSIKARLTNSQITLNINLLYSNCSCLLKNRISLRAPKYRNIVNSQTQPVHSHMLHKKVLTKGHDSHTLWKKMQLELDEQVHQYDADTWGDWGEQRPLNEYLGQIHSCPDHHVTPTQISPEIAPTSYSVKIFSLAAFLHITYCRLDRDAYEKHII